MPTALREPEALPYVDEHMTLVAAGADVVWRGLLATLDGVTARPGASSYARLVGCADSAASGPRPLAVGSTIPGFRVLRAVPERELVLQGCHRFSSYALLFGMEEVDATCTRLRAETRAVFPGLTGGAYRLLVLRTGGHVIGVRGLLAGVRRRAESQTR